MHNWKPCFRVNLRYLYARFSKAEKIRTGCGIMLRWRIPTYATTGCLFDIHLGQRAQAFMRQEGRRQKQQEQKITDPKDTGGF